MDSQQAVLEKYWTVVELCDFLQIARSTAYDWVHEGFIPHVKISGCVRFRPSDITAWLEQQARPGRARRVPEVEL
jgi:excisionase family DNA binding protein